MHLQTAHQPQIEGGADPVQQEGCRNGRRRKHERTDALPCERIGKSNIIGRAAQYAEACSHGSCQDKENLSGKMISLFQGNHIAVLVFLFFSSFIYGKDAQKPKGQDHCQRAKGHRLPVIRHKADKSRPGLRQAVIYFIGSIHADPDSGIFSKGIFIRTQYFPHFLRGHLGIGLNLHPIRIIIQITSVGAEFIRYLLLAFIGIALGQIGKITDFSIHYHLIAVTDIRLVFSVKLLKAAVFRKIVIELVAGLHQIIPQHHIFFHIRGIISQIHSRCGIISGDENIQGQYIFRVYGHFSLFRGSFHIAFQTVRKLHDHPHAQRVRSLIRNLCGIFDGLPGKL